MASSRVNASLFPRQSEVKTRCLMTVRENQSGNGVAPANEPGNIPGREIYMVLRLTSYSYSDDPLHWMVSGSKGCSFDSVCTAREFDWLGSEFAPPPEIEGNFEPYRNILRVHNDHAPMESTPVSSWSTTTSVDIAGWTEVVIQGGRCALSDVSIGYLYAKVNASVNNVLEAAVTGSLWLYRSGDGTSNGGAYRCPGSSEVNSSSISCPNNIMR